VLSSLFTRQESLNSERFVEELRDVVDASLHLSLTLLLFFRLTTSEGVWELSPASSPSPLWLDRLYPERESRSTFRLFRTVLISPFRLRSPQHPHQDGLLPLRRLLLCYDRDRRIAHHGVVEVGTLQELEGKDVVESKVFD